MSTAARKTSKRSPAKKKSPTRSANDTVARGRYYIEALGRGLSLLDCFVDGPAQLALAELSDRVRINRATTFRLLRTLEEAGYIRQEPQTKCYQLSLKMLDLQEASLAALEYPFVAQPYLEELNRLLGESVSMGVLDGTQVRYLARVASQSIMSVNLHVGSTLPAHATSMGKVLLAAMEVEKVQALYAGQPLQAFTPKTITLLKDLVRELAIVRSDGFATTNGELETGLRSASAPIYGRRGQVVAAINVSASTARVTSERLNNDFVPPLLRTAATISMRLGFQGNRPARPSELRITSAR